MKIKVSGSESYKMIWEESLKKKCTFFTLQAVFVVMALLAILKTNVDMIYFDAFYSFLMLLIVIYLEFDELELLLKKKTKDLRKKLMHHSIFKIAANLSIGIAFMFIAVSSVFKGRFTEIPFFDVSIYFSVIWPSRYFVFLSFFYLVLSVLVLSMAIVSLYFKSKMNNLVLKDEGKP